jgi:hypothetical protein
MPFKLEMSAGTDVAHKLRAEAGNALAAFVTDAPVRDSVRARAEEFARKRLGSHVARRIVNCAIQIANIMKIGVEVSDVKPHLEPRFEYADFGQFPPAMKRNLCLRSFKTPRPVPGAAVGTVKTSTIRTRMAISGPNHARLWTRDPFIVVDPGEDVEFG